MSWSVQTLQGLSGEAFELERRRIIDAYVNSLPEKSRDKIKIAQMNLDLQRTKMSSTEFTQHLATELKENLENLCDQLVALKNLVLGPPTSLTLLN